MIVIGEKSMTVAYTHTKDLKYVCAVRTPNYKWSNLMTELQSVIKRHCCPNANVHVYHHRLGKLGTVRKSGRSLFVPVGVTKLRKGMILPEAMMVNVMKEYIDDVHLVGWNELEAKIFGIFGLKKERIMNPIVRNVRDEIKREKMLKDQQIEREKKLAETRKANAVKAEKIKVEKAIMIETKMKQKMMRKKIDEDEKAMKKANRERKRMQKTIEKEKRARAKDLKYWVKAGQNRGKKRWRCWSCPHRVTHPDVPTWIHCPKEIGFD